MKQLLTWEEWEKELEGKDLENQWKIIIEIRNQRNKKTKLNIFQRIKKLLKKIINLFRRKK